MKFIIDPIILYKNKNFLQEVKGGGTMKRIRNGILILFLISGMLTGCGGATDTDGSGNAAEKELVIASAKEILGTDPHQVDTVDFSSELLVSPLLLFDKDLKNIEGFTAEKFEYVGNDVVLYIPEDLKFPDGTPVTPDDVVASFEHHLENSPYSEDFAPITDIETDGNKVILKCDKLPVFMMSTIASGFAGIISKNALESMSPEEFNANVTGYGPMYVDEWAQGSYITYKKNEYFKTYYPDVENKGPFKVDKITIKFIPDSFTRIQEFKSGNIDIIYDIPFENLEEVKELDDVTLFSYAIPGEENLRINMEKPLLNDINLREAIIKAVNKDEIVSALDNMIEARYSFLTPSNLCYDPAAEQALKEKYDYNIAEAQDALKRGGYTDEDGDGILEKDGQKLSFELLVDADEPFNQHAALIIQSQLKDVGIDIRIRELGGEYLYQIIDDEASYDLCIIGYEWAEPDILSYILTSDWLWIQDPALDQMLDDARYIADPQERTKAYNEINSHTMERMPGMPLYSTYSYIAARNNVKGFALTNDGISLFNDVDIAEE